MKKSLIIGIIIAILVVAGLLFLFGPAWGLFPFMLQNCERNQYCWETASAECKPAKYIFETQSNLEYQAEIYLEIRGREIFSNTCVGYVKILKFAPNFTAETADIPAELKAEWIKILQQLEGKDMICNFPAALPRPDNILSQREFCTGSLKEASSQTVTQLADLMTKITQARGQ
jgi:hypothetical protein